MQYLCLLLLLADPRPLTKIKKDYTEAFAKSDAKARVTLVAELAEKLDDDKYREALCWIAQADPDADVQLAAVRALAPRAADKKVREALLAAATARGEPVARSADLFKAETGGAIPTVRREIGAALRGSGEAVAALKKILLDKKAGALDRALAAELLGEIGGEEAVAALASAKHDATIARALGYTYHAAALGELQSWPSDPEVEAAIARLQKWEKSGEGVPDEKVRVEDTPRTAEVLFVVDVGPQMKNMMPSVLRLMRQAVAEKIDAPVRAALWSMKNGERGPEVEPVVAMTADVERVAEAITAMEIQKKGPPRIRGMRSVEAALREAAHRYGWSRNSIKRVYVFSAEGRLDGDKLDAVVAADLKEHEEAQLVAYHVETTAPTPAQFEAVAKAGGGRAERLVNSVPATIAVVLRGSAANEQTVRELFGVKRPELITRAPQVVEARFKNTAPLDLDALQAIAQKTVAGLDDLVFAEPNLGATYRAVEFKFTSHDTCYAAAQLRADEAVFALKGVAMVTAVITGQHEIKDEPKKPPSGGQPPSGG